MCWEGEWDLDIIDQFTYGNFYYIIKHLIKRHFIIITHRIYSWASIEREEPVFVYLRCNYYLFSCGIDVMYFNASCIHFFRFAFFFFFCFLSFSLFFVLILHLINLPFPLLPVQAFRHIHWMETIHKYNFFLLKFVMHSGCVHNYLGSRLVFHQNTEWNYIEFVSSYRISETYLFANGFFLTFYLHWVCDMIYKRKP